jgi:HD-GYP domain-containing protein (c-di-GMP phosphodiesterase class II)
MAPALPNYLAFGLLGALVGEFYQQLGPLALVLLATPLAISRSAFASFLEMRTAHEATIAVFLRAIEAKDPYTAGHTRRVARYVAYIGEELGLSPVRLQQLERSALMHDVGKLAVPSALLTKPGRLTTEEFALVQRHAHVCIDILEQIEFLRPMTAAASGHHARYDGGGYGQPTGPGGKKQPSQSLDAAIVAVADAYDAMTSTRAYRKALTQAVAFSELEAKAGSQLHPDCVAALIRALIAKGEHHGLGYEDEIVLYDTEPPVVGTGSAGLGDVDLREHAVHPLPAAPAVHSLPAEPVPWS